MRESGFFGDYRRDGKKLLEDSGYEDVTIEH